jgi:homopolymeric O-antigen transport system ATP-binding protein
MTALEVKNISKIYKIYGSPAHRVKEIVLKRPFHTVFHALRDVSFTLLPGDTLGIMGENGAGKSTLLKILAKTLKPTSGSLTVTGRVAALLELGAAFNPEFSGEENIYLNAYLIGLSRDEIDARKDDIIAFSELGDFIKRPVKTYSSGMQVRLAFSIATSVNPDILIIDEALSVGDQHFQKKCVDRMMEFKRAGKTILFCSHSLYLIQELCGRAIWLKQGKTEKIGETLAVINAYSDWVREKDAGLHIKDGGAKAPGGPRSENPLWLEWIKITDEEGREKELFNTGRHVKLSMRIRVGDSRNRYSGHVGIGLHRNDEVIMSGFTTKMDNLPPVTFRDGQEIDLSFPCFPLLAGQYYFFVVITDEYALHSFFHQKSSVFFVEHFTGELGVVKMDHQWNIRP